MTAQPAICIMIPTYNQAAYIVEAVESALQQDYPAKEIVVADDCSSDDTAALLQPYATTGRIRYVRNEKNIGRVANYRQCLYELATAPWVINLDGDDYFTSPGYLSAAMRHIQQAGPDEVFFFMGSHEGSTFRFEGPQCILPAGDFFQKYFHYRQFSHMSLLYQRHLAMESGFYEKDLLSTDIYSVLKACIRYRDKKIILSSAVSGTWRQHAQNLTRSVSLRQHAANVQLYRWLFREAAGSGMGYFRCLGWLLKAYYYYLRVIVGTFLHSSRV